MFARIESYESTVSLDSSDVRDIQESQAVFEAVETIHDLQQRNIDFIQGRLSATSYHFGPLMTNSVPLMDLLVSLNRLGFITTSSQPGRHYTDRGISYGQRCFVEGLLKKRYLSLFIEKMYRITGNTCFVVVPYSELTFEEIKHLDQEDRYWVTRSEIAGTKQGITHIPASDELACSQFKTCERIYPLLVDEYVNIFIMDVEWHRSSFLIEKVEDVLRQLIISDGISHRRSMRHTTS